MTAPAPEQRVEGYPDAPMGAVLTDEEIRRLVTACTMITPFDEGSLQGASYDLSLGEECFTRGEHLILNSEGPSHRLESGQFIVLTSFELLKLPDDVVGHAGLISRWAQRGLISLFSPQIDPGFEGRIVVPLFNGGHAPVTLKLRETMFTVEFARTTGCASQSWSSKNSPLLGIPAGVEVQMGGPDLSDLAQRVEALSSAVDKLQAGLAGYQVGKGESHGASGRKIGWISVAIGLIAIAEAVALALLIK